ncbi:hypothetical protein PoB_002987300 [Plakobranchus ocellatus]|uniref:Uncharacterized protein n=1 Tax=Plakobranchus ocellatus TaxID=259542 RepID=A0AAV4A817_9GAST|nr:hypothetical protein PoB_002987300 [Plakobranchus ocellatus]
MSSKRKNTPTKLPKEDLDNGEASSETALDNVLPELSDTQAAVWSNSDIYNKREDDKFDNGENISLNMRSSESPPYLDNSHTNGSLENDTNVGRSPIGKGSADSNTEVDGSMEAIEEGSDSGMKPTALTQPNDIDTVADRALEIDDSERNNSNSPFAAPSGGISSQKRSMESVIRRLNSKASDPSAANSSSVSSPSGQSAVAGGTDDNPKVMDTVQAVLAGEATLSEKERQISEMINHLQNIRENLSKQKEPSDCSSPPLKYSSSDPLRRQTISGCSLSRHGSSINSLYLACGAHTPHILHSTVYNSTSRGRRHSGSTKPYSLT